MFGLKEKHINAINACFALYPQIEQVLVYGSRAKGNYRDGSDIDLTIVGNLDFSSLLHLEKQLDNLLLPYKIDLSLHDNIRARANEVVAIVYMQGYCRQKDRAARQLQAPLLLGGQGA